MECVSGVRERGGVCGWCEGEEWSVWVVECVSSVSSVRVVVYSGV